MQSEFLESAEFYNRRYHNFSSRVIFPSFILFVFLLLFSIFAQKEVSVSARATIEPNRIIGNIQSTSNNSIVANYLEENKLVEQGEVLVQYQQGTETLQAEAYQSQLDTLKDQKNQLEYLRTSLQEGSDQFPEADKYGYQEAFKDYLSQVASLRSNTEQQNATISSQNAASLRTQSQIAVLIKEIREKIQDYKTAKSAIEDDVPISRDSAAYSLYKAFKNQREGDKQAKSQAIEQADTQISQLESNLEGYRVQYAGSGTQQAYATGMGSQLDSLKSQQLTKVGQELTQLNQKIFELETEAKAQASLLDKGVIKAAEDGVLHLNTEARSSKMVPEGTVLAQLYPLIDKEGKVKLTAYLNSKDIAGIQVGGSVRFTTVNDANKQIILTSTITGIDTTATKTETGNFFKIEADTDLTADQAEKIRYGLEGRLNLITGKKSFLNYYLDRLLRQN